MISPNPPRGSHLDSLGFLQDTEFVTAFKEMEAYGVRTRGVQIKNCESRKGVARFLAQNTTSVRC